MFPQFRFRENAKSSFIANLISRSSFVVQDENGKRFTVRYEAVNAMLLNEFLKEHRKAEQRGREQNEGEAAIQELESIVTRQQKEINALTTSLRTVSDELEREAKLLPSWSLIIIELNL